MRAAILLPRHGLYDVNETEDVAVRAIIIRFVWSV